jgi:hypothetical protein
VLRAAPLVLGLTWAVCICTSAPVAAAPRLTNSLSASLPVSPYCSEPGYPPDSTPAPGPSYSDPTQPVPSCLQAISHDVGSLRVEMVVFGSLVLLLLSAGLVVLIVTA